MATKLGRKEMPSGHSANDFTYQGRPAKDQHDFGIEVGLADMACVNQFGEANNSKYYHAGVVKDASGGWWTYLEWGRMKSARSWNGSFGGGDFQFVRCSSESEARDFFAKQCASKNTKRLRRTVIAGIEVWAGKAGKDGYIVQDLATREKGLPDAYKIKDSAGLAAKPKDPVKKVTKTAAPTRSFQPQVVDFARALVGGTKSFTRAMSQAAGVTPTADAIKRVRDQYIPAALSRIKAIGDDINSQVKDSDLRDLTKLVAAIVPRPIARSGQNEADFILSGGNVLALQADLDAFEAALASEDFEVEHSTPSFDPNASLGCAEVRWLDPRGEGRWLAEAFASMTNGRHSYIRGDAKVKNIFAVTRPQQDAKFRASVERVAAKRAGRFGLKANLQPRRSDLAGWESDAYAQANVIMGIHATRPVNFAPILQTNFRLPRSLPGAQITGANFGHGVYYATDWRKSYGYTGRGYWGSSGGGVANRGCFMFLCDMVMGDAYRAPRTGSWGSPPDSKDSVFGVGGDRGHRLENDEHVIFDPTYQRIRYVVEFDWLT